MEDQSILNLLWARSETAIQAMARTFGSRLYRTAMNLIGIHQDAEEVVSDTYLAVWNAIPPKRPEPLAGFVLKTGRNLALNRLRSLTAQKRTACQISLDELADCIAGPDLWEQLDARSLGEQIDAFLDTLPRTSRILFLRRYWFGDEVNALAREFSMTPNAVSVRLSRIRTQLKVYLSKEGFYD